MKAAVFALFLMISLILAPRVAGQNEIQDVSGAPAAGRLVPSTATSAVDTAVRIRFAAGTIAAWRAGALRPTSTPQPSRIQFQPGATSAAVSGELAPGGTRTYVLRANAGQIMQVTLWPSVGANVLIWGADGSRLNRGLEEEGWQGTLPKSQDYTIQVIGRDHTVSYCLRVTVFARIQFARGATSATVSSPIQTCIPQGVEVVGAYALRASAGQTMRVTLNSPNHNVLLTIVGADGASVKYYDDWSTVWEGLLPTTQDYHLLLVATGSDSRFNMAVTIRPLSQTPPTRIQFAAGTTSATVSGSLAQGTPARYVLWAARGQRMEIRIWPAPTEYAPPRLDVAVTGPGGSAWSDLTLDDAIDPLPASGDYIVTLALQPESPGTNYSLQVSLVPTGGAAGPHEVTITARSVRSALDIEQAIKIATNYGSRPGIITLDAKDGPFTYTEPDKSINIFHPNLTLRSLNGAVITNCDDGIFFDEGGSHNVVVRGITFHCAGTGIDTPTFPYERLVFEDNVIEAGRIGIALGTVKDVLIRRNRVTADHALHAWGTSGAWIGNNDLRGVIGMAFEGSEGNVLVNNHISAQRQGVFLMSGADDNNVIGNRINGPQAAGIAFEGNNANNRVYGNCVVCAAGFECLLVDANAPGARELNEISGNKACE